MSSEPQIPVANGSTTDGGDYVVVARRYRPQTFEDLVGQGQVSQALSNAINTHRVGHAYLFTGARGVGKTSTARIFAKALNCVQGPTPRPCNQCDICQGVAQGGDVDVIEIDGASNRGIDEIRQLRSNVSVRPSRARFKIYIIDEVHMLTTAAFNALLKTLEEPPEHVKFIFCTTDPEKIPITVLSRCQRFDFPPVEADSIIQRLRHIVVAEGLEADDEALRLLARRAAGSMRDSQSLLEQLLAFTSGRITVDDVHKMLGTAGGGRLQKLAERLVNRDAAGALEELESATHESVDVGQLAEQLLGYFRDLMAVAVGCQPGLLLHASSADYAELKQLADRWGLETTLAAVQVLDTAVTKMRHSIHARVLLEVALVRICKLEDLEELAQLAARLQAGAAVPASGPRATPPMQPRSPVSAVATDEKKKLTESPPARPQVTPSRDDSLEPEPGRSSAAHDSREVSADSSITTAVAAIEAEPTGNSRPVVAESDASPRVPPASDEGSLAPAVETVVEDRDHHGDMEEGDNVIERLSEDGTRPASGTATSGTATSGTATSGTATSGTAVPGASGDGLRMRLDARSARQVWEAALDLLEDMTADFGRFFESVGAPAADRLVVRFRPQYNLQKQSLEKPDRRAKIEQALAEVVGGLVRVEFELLAGETRPVERRTAPVSRVVKMREREKNPFVQQAKAMFDAEIVDVQEPRTEAVRSEAVRKEPVRNEPVRSEGN